MKILSPVKKKVINRFKNIYAGVYCITCKGRKYIGFSLDAEAEVREHLRNLKGGKHRVKIMQADYNKFGQSSFKISYLGKVNDDFLKQNDTDLYKAINKLVEDRRKEYNTYDLLKGYNVLRGKGVRSQKFV